MKNEKDIVGCGKAVCIYLLVGGVVMARKPVDINKLLEETRDLELIQPNFEIKRVDIDALLDLQIICEICNDRNCPN